MVKFRSWRNYSDFERNIRQKRRFIRSGEEKEFLETLLESSKKRTEQLPTGTTLWRSQLGFEVKGRMQEGVVVGEDWLPHKPQRMKPIQGHASEGRVNSGGIPCLYLATDRETAMAEVRPWIGSMISLGLFQIVRDLSLINCTVRHPYTMFHWKEPEPEKRELAVWSDIDNAFSKPVDRSDFSLDYVPTQVVAEFFKEAGYDGVAYRSALGKGHNVALFDIKSADLVGCELCEVERVTFKFKKSGVSYGRSKQAKNP